MAYQTALAAMADPTRRGILERLRGGPLSVGEIAAGLPVSRPAVSQHLRVLGAAQLVRVEVRGTRHLYAIDPAGLDALRRYLQQYWGAVLDAFSAHAREIAGRRRPKRQRQRPKRGARK